MNFSSHFLVVLITWLSCFFLKHAKKFITILCTKNGWIECTIKQTIFQHFLVLLMNFHILKLIIIINRFFLDFAWNGNAICGNSFYKTGNLCFETSLHRIFCSRGMGSLLLCRHTYFELWTGVSARIIICFRKLKWGLGCSKKIRCWRGEGWTKKFNRPTSKPFPYLNSYNLSIFSPIFFNFFSTSFSQFHQLKKKTNFFSIQKLSVKIIHRFGTCCSVV